MALTLNPLQLLGESLQLEAEPEAERLLPTGGLRHRADRGNLDRPRPADPVAVPDLP